MVVHTINVGHRVTGLLGVCALLIFSYAGAIADTKPEVVCRDGKMTVNAQKTPLIPLLESLAQTSGVEIFVSEDLEPHTVSVRFTDKEMEDALRTMLKGLSYAVVYHRNGESWRISSINIYPANKKTGRLKPVASAKEVSSSNDHSGDLKIMMVDSLGKNMYMGINEGGLLVPSRSIADLSDEKDLSELRAPWFQMQRQLERKESVKYQELMLMKKRLESTRDPDKKAALSLAFADELADFHKMKTANLNKVESLKRIYQNREMNQ